MVTFEYLDFKIELPSPNNGDTQTIKLRTKPYRAMDGTVWSYISTPNQYVFKLSFGNVNRPKILEMIQFLKDTTGITEIIYTDYEKVPWIGTILTKPFESQHVGPRNSSFSLEFEGVQASN